MSATLLQRVTTDAVRGRAVGVMMTTDTVGEAVGSLLFPVLVTTLGGAIVLGVTGGLLLAATVVGLVLIGSAITRAPTPFDAILARVSRLPLFAGVPGAALEAALGRIQVVPVLSGQGIVRQGEPSDRFYIIETGEFVVRRTDAEGVERVLRRLGPDEVFGELGLLTDAPRSATVEAITDGTLLALDGPDFLALVAGRTTVRGQLLGLYESPATTSRAD
jgi:Cyclic nucleotide-binding domain